MSTRDRERKTWLRIPVLPLVELVDLAQETISPSSNFLKIKKIVLAHELTGRIKLQEMTYANCLVQCLGYGRNSINDSC